MPDCKTVLVTGGCGFIGSHFVKLLVLSGYIPAVLDKMTYAADPSRLKINGSPFNSKRLYMGDICDKNLCEEIIKNHDIDIIVNFAAETHVDRSIVDSSEFMHSNILGVQVLLDLSRKHDLKMIQVSTDEVYGSTEVGSFKETDRLNPSNPYAASKASADLLALSYYKTYGLRVIVTRSTNNYGPYQHPEKFIPKMITDAMAGKPLSVYGDGKNVRDWLYVGDNCEAIKVVMDHGSTGEIYNIGAGNELPNNEVAKIISNRFKIPVRYVTDRPGHDLRYSVSFRKIFENLGWKPAKNFYIGLDETINHLKANQ